MTRMICGILRLDGGPADRDSAMQLALAMIAPGLDHRISLADAGPLAVATVKLAPRGAKIAEGEDGLSAGESVSIE